MSTASEFLNGPVMTVEAARTARRERWQTRIARVSGFLNVLGLGWVVPLLRIAAGENVKPQLAELWRSFGIPMMAIVLFLGAWAFARAEGPDQPRRIAGAGAGLAAGRKSVGRSSRRARQEAGVLRAPGQAQRRNARARPEGGSEVPALHRRADLSRSDRHQPGDGVRRLLLRNVCWRCRSACCAACRRR